MSAECPGCQEVRRDAAEKVAALEKLLMLRIDAIEKLNDTRVSAAAEALRIQTAELSRRLDALNGEADRLREMQATYLPREGYMETIAQLRAYRDTAVGRQSILTALISALFAAAAVVINYFLSFGVSRGRL